MKSPRQPLRVLLVEDSPDDADLVLYELNEGGFDVDCSRVETGAAMCAALAEDIWDVVISDFNLPRFSTREALAVLREVDADIPFIIVSGCIGEESAIALMKEGVSDFVMKDKLARLVPAIERELQDASMRREHRRAQEALREREQRYRGIFDNVLDTLFLLEVTADVRFRNLEVNPAFEKSSGMSSAALVGKFIEETVPEEIAQAVIAKYRRCVAAGKVTDEEITLELPNGIRHYHSSLIPVRDEGGRIHRIIGISRDITERKQAESDLLKSRTELRELTAYLQTVREEERTRIARELHDELGQMLTGVKLDAMWISSHLPASQLSGENPDIASKVAAMSQLIDETLDAMRRVAADLRPVMLDDLGLVAAIEWLTEEFGKRTGISVQLEREVGQPKFGCGGRCERDGCSLEPDVATAAFRIVQECLTNVARHAQATHVQVFFKCRDGQLKIWVSDDGKGISEDHERKRNSYGIIGMQERAHSLGGTLEVSSVGGKGISVKVVLPIKAVSCAGGAQ